VPSILTRKKVGEFRLGEEGSDIRELKSGGGGEREQRWSAEEG
jgi:hypothetical protein